MQKKKKYNNWEIIYIDELFLLCHIWYIRHVWQFFEQNYVYFRDKNKRSVSGTFGTFGCVLCLIFVFFFPNRNLFIIFLFLLVIGKKISFCPCSGKDGLYCASWCKGKCRILPLQWGVTSGSGEDSGLPHLIHLRSANRSLKPLPTLANGFIWGSSFFQSLL